MSPGNETLARHAVEAFIRGEIDEALEHASPSIVTTRSPPLPDAQTYHGHEGVLQAYAGWAKEFAELEMEVGESVDLGDDVLLELKQRATGSASGVEVVASFWLLYRFEDGLISSFGIFATREQALGEPGGAV